MGMFERLGVRRLLMAVLAVALLVPLKPAAVQAQGTYEGILTIIWGDPQFPGTAGDIRYTLNTPDGQYVPVQVTQSPNEVLQHNGHHVLVSGQMASSTAASAAGMVTERSLLATSIVDDPRIPNQAPLGRFGVTADPTSGTKKVIFVLLKYAGDTQT